MLSHDSVPAWEVQTGRYSDSEFVFVLTDELDGVGWPRTKLVHRLTPVSRSQQERLRKVRPAWMMEQADA